MRLERLIGCRVCSRKFGFYFKFREKILIDFEVVVWRVDFRLVKRE